jgi:apolipoprotein D and lipocalin family protein
MSVALPRTLVAFAAAVTFALATACARAADAPPLSTVGPIDATRYAGAWYEVARFPNWFQKRCTGDVTAQYALRDDGRIDVRNTCTREDGRVDVATAIARRAPADGDGSKLEVSFLPAALRWVPFTWGRYWVVDLDADYRWAVVSEPKREYLWVLSRTPTLPRETWDAIVGRLAANGFATDRLVVTRQGGAPAVAP